VGVEPVVPSVSSTRLRAAPPTPPAPQPGLDVETLEFGLAAVAVSVALGFGWVLGAHRGVPGLSDRHGWGSAAVVIAVAGAGALRSHQAATRGAVALHLASAGFAAVALAVVAAALTLGARASVPGWLAWWGAGGAAAASAGAGLAGLRHAHGCLTARPPRVAAGAAVGVASVAALAGALRVLL
jgi:hypothetical protein